MGSDAHLLCMQSWCRCLLRDLLFPIPSALGQAPQIRHPVSLLRLQIPPDRFFTLSGSYHTLALTSCGTGGVVRHAVVEKPPWVNQSPRRIPTPSSILLCLVIWTGPDRLSLSNRWSVGSLLFLLSWAVLMGPVIYARHLISGSRLPFTAAYFGSIALTLYFAIGVSLFLPFVRLDFRWIGPPCMYTPCI